jgi:uncharacterized phage protein (TIGR01671 family)
MHDEVWGWRCKDESDEKPYHVVSADFEQHWLYGIDTENVILMQYTGLKDKNGKEIYEGDIVIRKEVDWSETEDDCPYGEEPQKEAMRDVVTMDRYPRFWLQHEAFGYKGECLEHPDECEVIGNIYENPELLEAVHA